MTPSEEKTLSKFMSLVLRHDPGAAGVSLDSGGWVEIDSLVDGARAREVDLTRAKLLAVVAGSPKQRFTLNADETRIRAAQGHSVPVDLDLVPCQPPKELFHGTAARNIPAISAEGLKPGARTHVHLSGDLETAVQVGQRHGSPVVFLVDTVAASDAGQAFYRAENGVWLTDALPAQFLRLQNET